MRQLRFMVAASALQDVVRALYSGDNKEIRTEIYVCKKDGDLVVVVTEHNKGEEGVKPEPYISPSVPPPWASDPITTDPWENIPRKKKNSDEISK